MKRYYIMLTTYLLLHGFAKAAAGGGVLGALEPKVLGEELLVQYAPMLAPRSMLRYLCFALIILRCGSISSDDETLTLTFEVCGGLTNQRMALVHGFMIAHITNRSVLLPWLNPNGVQTGKSYHEDRSNLVPFSKFFDVAMVTAALAPLVRVAGLRPEPPPANLDSKWVVERKLRKKEWYRSLADRTNGMPLEFDCTFLALDSRGDQHLLELYWKMDDALHFAPRYCRRRRPHRLWTSVALAFTRRGWFVFGTPPTNRGRLDHTLQALGELPGAEHS